jgi:outer membrane protein
MQTLKLAAVAAIAAAAVSAPAHAETASRWFVHAGPAFVKPEEKTSMSLAGAPVPGGDVKIDGRWTVEGELGYFVTPNIAIAVAGGFPPQFTVKAAGSVAALGTAGKMTGGPAGLLAQYHFNRDGRIQPYVGAGASFLIVFNTKDGAMSDLKAPSRIGTALQAGTDVMVNDRLGLYVDVKKAWVGTVATGFVGPMPVRAKVKIDPIVASAGVAYHF